MKKVFFIAIGVLLIAGIIFGYIRLETVDRVDDSEVEIVFADPLISLNPYSFALNNNQRLRFIYEPLVKLGANLNIKPGLARSFGRVDENTWEFTINPNAEFHNGEKVSAQIVVAALEKLKNMKEAEGLTDSIGKLTVIDDITFTLATKYPDPVLLNKLSLLPVTPDKSIEELKKNPIGTGQFRFVDYKDNTLELKKNENYYGEEAAYEKVFLTGIENRDKRVSYSLNNDRVAMIYPFPLVLKNKLSANSFNIFKTPNLAVNFFLFNFRTSFFDDPEFRRFMMQTINKDDLIKLTDKLGRPVSQYVPTGILGYNKNISTQSSKFDELKRRAEGLGLNGVTFRTALPKGLDVFKNFLNQKWKLFGLDPVIELIPRGDLVSDDTKVDYNLIFLGWKSDYGDSSQFFENIVKSNAKFNMGGYSNDEVDRLLEEAGRELDISKRREKLERIMEIIVHEDPVGIPLFETEIIYAVDTDYTYTPRSDGFIDLSALKRINFDR